MPKGNVAADLAAEFDGEWEEIQPFTEPVVMAEGEEIVGVYVGAETIDIPAADDDRSDTVTMVDGRRVRPTLLHLIHRSGDSEPVGIWGSAVLDKRLADVYTGTVVRIRYEGKQDLDGGRTARRYRVWRIPPKF